MPRYEAKVDPAICTGAQMCVSIAPETFSYDPTDGVSKAVGGPSEDPQVVEAAELCPVEAVTVRELDTGEQVFP